MGAVACPTIEVEMNEWVSYGGGNSGIVGDQNHTYGFHCSANNVGSDDYSRYRDPNGSDGPYDNWNWCCAGDFSHKNKANLRAMHADVLDRLMSGEMPMICEFIGKPLADEPVLYWARWNGIGTLQKYTGEGHDSWSHISWYRSRASERAYLWRPPEPLPTIPHEDTEGMVRMMVKAKKGMEHYHIKRLQTILNDIMKVRDSHGNRLDVDGIFGANTDYAFRKWQEKAKEDRGKGVTGVVETIDWSLLLTGTTSFH